MNIYVLLVITFGTNSYGPPSPAVAMQEFNSVVQCQKAAGLILRDDNFNHGKATAKAYCIAK